MPSGSPGRRPTFVIVGAPKAGTTSLYRWCGQHPAVWMSPIKEPSFFAPEVADVTPRAREAFAADAPALREWLDSPRTEPRRRGLVLDWEDYLSLFRDAGAATAVGEASGNYLPSHTAPSSLRARIPEARVVMLLREPVDRLFSQFASAVAAGQAHGSFDRWVDAELGAESRRTPRLGAVWTGMYGAHVRRWLDAFPRAQVRIYLHEDLAERPHEVLADLFDFIGVDAAHPVDVAIRHNVTTVSRWPGLSRALRPVSARLGPRLPAGLRRGLRAWTHGAAGAALRPTPEARARVQALYHDDLQTLEALIGRDLGAWRSAASPG